MANHLRESGTLQLPFVTFTMSLFALPLGFVLGLATSSLAFLRYLGRNTLPVYVLHRFILAVLAPVLLKLGAPTDMVGELVMPPTLAVLTIVVALLVFWLTQRLGLRGLFELPSRDAGSAPVKAASPV